MVNTEDDAEFLVAVAASLGFSSAQSFARATGGGKGEGRRTGLAVLPQPSTAAPANPLFTIVEPQFLRVREQP